MDVTPRSLRHAFGSFMTGVTVVTARTSDGDPVGFTANSFTSVSLEPPLLLVCPGRHLSSFETFATCRSFAVNILADDQQHIADVFATASCNRFANLPIENDPEGVPLLKKAVSTFSCFAHKRIDAGDHIILLGRVHAFTQSSRAPLGFTAGRYFTHPHPKSAA